MNTLLVAIPVWPGDYETVLANLDKQFERDGLTNHKAFVFSDGRLTKEQHELVQHKAEQCFSRVFNARYANSKAGHPWPEPQNFTWQHIARSMEEMDIKPEKGWFMWESDALPLKPKWIDILAEAYVKARKPFMGHVVPLRGHMNAVSIYPFNVSFYATKAMLVKASPFDVMLSIEVGINNIFSANHLIVHRLKAKGGDAPIPITGTTIKSFPETAVIAHGYFDPNNKQLELLKEQRKRQAMNETSKAMRRRRCEEAGGGFKWSVVFSGSGVDVGSGADPIQIPGCKPFDIEDGDANYLSRNFTQESLDYIHASQCLEHMVDPRSALLNWATCLRKGGYIVASVPDFDLYEHRNWPSRFNPDHKSAWSTWRKSDKKRQ